MAVNFLSQLMSILNKLFEAHASKSLAKFYKEVNILPERQYTLSGILKHVHNGTC